MTGSLPLQSSSELVSQATDFLAIIILLVYAYYYIEYRREGNQKLKREARQRATLTLFGFTLYAIFIAMFGPSNSFVAPIGTRVETYFESLAQRIVMPGLNGSPGGQVGAFERVLSGVKLLGLIVYVGFFGAVSASNAVIAKLAGFITNLGSS